MIAETGQSTGGALFFTVRQITGRKGTLSTTIFDPETFFARYIPSK